MKFPLRMASRGPIGWVALFTLSSLKILHLTIWSINSMLVSYDDVQAGNRVRSNVLAFMKCSCNWSFEYFQLSGRRFVQLLDRKCARNSLYAKLTVFNNFGCQKKCVLDLFKYVLKVLMNHSKIDIYFQELTHFRDIGFNLEQ